LRWTIGSVVALPRFFLISRDSMPSAPGSLRQFHIKSPSLCNDDLSRPLSGPFPDDFQLVSFSLPRMFYVHCRGQRTWRRLEAFLRGLVLFFRSPLLKAGSCLIFPQTSHISEGLRYFFYLFRRTSRLSSCRCVCLSSTSRSLDFGRSLLPYNLLFFPDIGPMRLPKPPLSRWSLVPTRSS